MIAFECRVLANIYTNLMCDRSMNLLRSISWHLSSRRKRSRVSTKVWYVCLEFLHQTQGVVFPACVFLHMRQFNYGITFRSVDSCRLIKQSCVLRSTWVHGTRILGRLAHRQRISTKLGSVRKDCIYEIIFYWCSSSSDEIFSVCWRLTTQKRFFNQVTERIIPIAEVQVDVRGELVPFRMFAGNTPLGPCSLNIFYSHFTTGTEPIIRNSENKKP